MKIPTLLAAIFALSTAAATVQADPDLPAMLRRFDTLTNFTTDFTGSYNAFMAHKGEKPVNIQARMFRRDREGKFVILISAPQAQKGQGYLEIDNNLWFYDPTSRLFSHSSLKDNWQSSDAMNSDFYRTSYAKDYAVESWKEDTLGTYPVYVLQLKATSDEVQFPFKKVWVRKDIGVFLKSEDYSLSRFLMRSSYYPAYVKLGEQYVASKMLFVDELNKGNKTQLELTDTSVDSLPDSVFTKAYIERASR